MLVLLIISPSQLHSSLIITLLFIHSCHYTLFIRASIKTYIPKTDIGCGTPSTEPTNAISRILNATIRLLLSLDNCTLLFSNHFPSLQIHLIPRPLELSPLIQDIAMSHCPSIRFQPITCFKAPISIFSTSRHQNLESFGSMDHSHLLAPFRSPSLRPNSDSSFFNTRVNDIKVSDQANHPICFCFRLLRNSATYTRYS